MSARSFDRWWVEFRSEAGTGDDPHETARRLRRHLRRLDRIEQLVFLDRLCEVLLQEKRSYGVALFLLEGTSDPADLKFFAKHISPLPELQSDDEEGHLADLMRIFAASGEPDLVPVVETYFLHRDIGPQWDTAPWALWPHRRDLFARTWSRFFTERDPSAWNTTLVVRSFLTEPDAVDLVRGRLVEHAPQRWDELRKALVRQVGRVTWLTPEQRASLDRILT